MLIRYIYIYFETDMMPHGEEQINASSRMECSPIQVTPIFRSLAEGIPSPEFSESVSYPCTWRLQNFNYKDYNNNNGDK
jgi:hypothetical protein